MNFHYFHTARGAIAIRSHEPPRAPRRTLRFAILLGVVALLLAFLPKAASAQDVQYDAQLAKDRMVLIQLIYRTSDCMHTAAKAGLAAGMTRRDHLESFAASSCGPGIRDFLVSRVGMSLRDAERSVNAMAADAVKDVLSWGR